MSINHVGVDFGTACIKACTTHSPGEVPRLIGLGGGDNIFLPCCVNQSTGAIGWGPYQTRYTDRGNILNYFRDRTHTTTERMPAIADSQQLLNTVVTGVTSTCQHILRSPDSQEQLNASGSCFGWSIPDHWTTDDWPLTQSIGAHGSLPAVLVRESMAVLAYSQLKPIEAPALILLSLGFGSIRATICTAQSGKWQCKNSPRKTPQAGYLLREELARHWDDQVIVREVKKTLATNSNKISFYEMLSTSLL